jgi:hypothetical protein
MKSRQELETVIRASAADASWDVFTEDPKMIRRLRALYGDGLRVSEFGWRWVVPLNLIRPRRARLLTEESKQKRAAALASARAKRP